MNNAQLINQTSGEVEIYTPGRIVEAARKALGGIIELDPASSGVANRTVMALKIFTKDNDGLSMEWRAETVWMNHPFSRKENSTWINKLIREFLRGNVGSACCITFASTSEGWFRPLMEFPQCFLSPRTNYVLPDGTVYRGVTKGSVVTYMGRDLDKFKEAFAGMGKVKV